MGNENESEEKPLKSIKKGLLDLDLIKVPEMPSKLNIFICAKYESDSIFLYNKLVNNKDYNKKKNISKHNHKNNYYQKSRYGIYYNRTKKEHGNSYWKFYELSSIESPNECESLKNIIEKKNKKRNNSKCHNIYLWRK